MEQLGLFSQVHLLFKVVDSLQYENVYLNRFTKNEVDPGYFMGFQDCFTDFTANMI